MPIVAAIPAIAGGLGAAASAKSLLSSPDAPSQGGAAPERAVSAPGAAKSYNRVEDALARQKAFTEALQAAGGIQNQAQVYDQLQGIAAGTGPNPAMAALNNATGQNVAQQAALLASQRGASANPALMARLAAQQGGAIQQQAIGQGAALQAQQSLNAINQAGNIANTQVAGASQAGQALTGAEQNTYGQLLNQIASQNNTAAGLQGNVNSANASMYGPSLQAQQAAMGGIGSGIATLGKLFPDQPNQPNSIRMDPAAATGVQSRPVSGLGLAKGGEVEGSHVYHYFYGGNVGDALKSGGTVPGQPVVPGAKDSYKNDTVDAKLSPGEIVIPRSITKGKDPVKNAAAFVAATLAKNGRSLPKKK